MNWVQLVIDDLYNVSGKMGEDQNLLTCVRVVRRQAFAALLVKTSLNKKIADNYTINS